MLTLAGPCDFAGMDFVTKAFQTQAALTLSVRICGLPAFLGIIPHSPRENDLPVLSASNLLASHHPQVHFHPPTLLKSMMQQAGPQLGSGVC